MGKGKKPTNSLSKGAKGRRIHGPNTHLHHDIQPKALRFSISRTGVLDKYHDYESWARSVSARGGRNISREEFHIFALMTFEKKKEYLNNIKRK